MYLDEELNDPAPLELTDKEVFTGLLTAPKTVFRFIHESQYTKYSIILLGLGGISRAFDRAASKGLGDTMSLWTIIGACIVGGALLGWLGYYLYAALLTWTGKWLKGEGDSTEVYRVVTYALFPVAIGLLLLVPQIALLGIGVFQSDLDFSELDMFGQIVYYGTVVLEVALAVWAFILVVIGLAEVQKFTYPKAFLNAVMPVLALGVPLLIMILLLQS